MILVDTSVWADHFRSPDGFLSRQLDSGRVLCHSYVIGEVAMGYLRQRTLVLRNLHALKSAVIATDEEVLDLVEREHLFGLGIGYIDAHLLASARLTPSTALWTRDKRLAGVAAKIGLPTV